MTASLCFNDFTFSPVIRNNQPWFRSSELARALGYGIETKIPYVVSMSETPMNSPKT